MNSFWVVHFCSMAIGAGLLALDTLRLRNVFKEQDWAFRYTAWAYWVFDEDIKVSSFTRMRFLWALVVICTPVLATLHLLALVIGGVLVVLLKVLQRFNGPLFSRENKCAQERFDE